MYIIDNRAIDKLVLNHELRTVCPFLALTEEKKACCGKPGGFVPRYEAIKANFAFMTQECKDGFKKILGLEKVCVYHKGPKGQIRTEF